MSRENITIVRDFYNMALLAKPTTEALDPAVEWVEPDVPPLWFSGTHHGPQAVLEQVIEPGFEKFHGFRVEVDEYLDAGDRVVVSGRFLGQHRETGNKLDAPFAHILTLRNGKIVRFCGYTDTANWLQAIGCLHSEMAVGAHD